MTRQNDIMRHDGKEAWQQGGIMMTGYHAEARRGRTRGRRAGSRS